MVVEIKLLNYIGRFTQTVESDTKSVWC